MANNNLSEAKSAKNDEFYTQYEDIQREVNAYLEYDPDVFRGKTILLPCDDPEWSNFTKFFAQNFEFFGLKKLISTSYAADSKPKNIPYQLTMFERSAPKFDKKKTYSHGKIFVLTRDTNKSGRIDINDLEWSYLEGDGDFRSEEVKKIRDEADIIVTNPPFSLFREFVAWLFETNKKFLIIGSKNSITYKEIFPLIKENRLWLGNGFSHGNAYFGIPNSTIKDYANGVFDAQTGLVKFRNVSWYTNIEHGRRHQPLQLMTMAENIKFSKHREIREYGYRKYDNYDAIEVPYTDAIPSDYFEDMGVPISYLDKHNPDQFEIVKFRKGNDEKDLTYTIGFDYNFNGTERNGTERNGTERNGTERNGTERNGKLRLTSELSSDGRCNGVMGVPISFLDKYNPEQFEILGMCENLDLYGLKTRVYSAQECRDRYFELFGKKGIYDMNAAGVVDGIKVYQRILIKHRRKS